jgi:hypothetical protein
MKKIITYTMLCLIAILLLPSCKGKMGITKRHYTKGYYVSHTKGKNNAVASKTLPKNVGSDNISSMSVLSTVAKENKTELVPQPKENTMASAFSVKKENTNLTPMPAYKNTTIAKPITEFKKLVLIPRTSAGDGEGLSLFWIVILVIVLLWAFGFLAGGFGLGGLINILLVVALILLILWLLRVL